MDKNLFLATGLFCTTLFAFHFSAATATATVTGTLTKGPAVSLAWTYESFPLKMQVFTVKPEKALFISETASVGSLKDTPALSELKGPVQASLQNSTPLVLIVENPSDKDVYFFAVPHEMNPSTASAGHYFECLCIGKVYKIPPKSTWYRIVRINLDKSFQKVKAFEIMHKLVGVEKREAETKYKSRLYE